MTEKKKAELNEYFLNIKLNFDPANTDDTELRRVFRSNISRILWLGIGCYHLKDQYFAGKIRRAGESLSEIKRLKKRSVGQQCLWKLEPKPFVTLGKFIAIVSSHLGFGFNLDRDYYKILYACVMGKQKMNFTIESSKEEKICSTKRKEKRKNGRRKRVA